ncbi:DUF4007 family protein [Photobacterium angustum]|uniref:DUF4007 domain-containing protein n=1 Tax=Photobacterium angustum TaxID=661 RepID=A0A855S947_PHOAN|nr:DUF4007 family protein [Photobacterium angustum]PSX05536.1 DUF4007 domain-containing protein [Photobacterium angustum]PSX14249.1 DUF4007 domain-containing protein [Photobacterium angustum]PSX22790.1 DUF4007 domain-containing protein [Photobacterium angustum]PSX39727.1 DUF4007 domain-containing protein [Photobacterium angustum]
MSIESSILKFSGHQTFPVRYGWIYKIIKEILDNNSISDKQTIESQMVSMGMGKNMVLSIRHWIRVLNLVVCTDKKNQTYELTDLAKRLFVNDNKHPAYDEYIDKIGTVWLLHWLTQSIPSDNAELNTSRWFFNYFNGIRTDKLQLAKDINLSLLNHSKEITEATLKKDIDCFFQTYSTKYTSTSKINEDSFTSPFTELGLIVQFDSKNYLAELTDRKSLPIEVFTYALIDFIQNKQKDNKGEIISDETTISFDTLLNDVGSPGKVFRLTSNGLSDKLDDVEKLTQGKIAWTDTQGLKQVQHHFDDLHKVEPSVYLDSYYQR